MRKTISVAALLLALTCPAYAGDMQNDSPKPPANGIMQNDEPESLTQTVLDLLAALPSLF